MNIINIEKINNGDTLYQFRKKVNENFQAVAGTNNLFKGYHIDLDRLNLEYPPANNQKGWFAFVGITFPLTIYKVVDNGGSWWETAGKVPGPDIDLSFFAEHGGYEGTLKDLDNAKVDKVEGKSLVTDTEITKLSELPTKEQLDKYLGDKADKIVNNKSVVYATDGDITKEARFLASDAQNGLLSKELFKQINNNTDLLKEYEMAIKDMTPPHMRFKTKIQMVFNNDTESIQYNYGALRFNTSTTIVDERLLLVEVNKETNKLTMPSQANTTVRHAVVLPVGKTDYNIYTSDIKSILCYSGLTKMQYMEVSSNDVNLDRLNLNAAYGNVNINKYTSLKYLAWGREITQKTVDCVDSKELLEFNGAKNKHFVSFYFDGLKIQKINLQGCSSFSDMLTASSALNLKEVDLSGTASIIETLKNLNTIWNTGNNGTLTINAALHTKLINEAPDLYTAFVNKGITIVSVA